MQIRHSFLHSLRPVISSPSWLKTRQQKTFGFSLRHCSLPFCIRIKTKKKYLTHFFAFCRHGCRINSKHQVRVWEEEASQGTPRGIRQSSEKMRTSRQRPFRTFALGAWNTRLQGPDPRSSKHRSFCEDVRASWYQLLRISIVGVTDFRQRRRSKCRTAHMAGRRRSWRLIF